MGWVYLAEAIESDGETIYHKIGKTKQRPQERIEQIASSMPIPVKLVHAIKCEHAREGGCERILHARFVDHHVNGEWFDLSTDQVEWIRRVAGFRFDSDYHYSREVREAGRRWRMRKPKATPDPFVMNGALS